MIRKVLLVCGILSSLLYVVMNVVAPLRYAGYSSISQTVSELSAIGSPTRAMWVPLGIAYNLLLIAFGTGVWMSSQHQRSLRIVGALLIGYGLFGFGWPPMHQREVLAAGGGTLTDTLHLVWAGVTVLLMFLFISVGASALGKGFRLYSIGTIIVLLTFGALTSLDGPRVGANLPTPWVGVWERLSILADLIWISVLSVLLMRVQSRKTEDMSGSSLMRAERQFELAAPLSVPDGASADNSAALSVSFDRKGGSDGNEAEAGAVRNSLSGWLCTDHPPPAASVGRDRRGTETGLPGLQFDSRWHP
jgi:hypothetical protein